MITGQTSRILVHKDIYKFLILPNQELIDFDIYIDLTNSTNLGLGSEATLHSFLENDFQKIINDYNLPIKSFAIRNSPTLKEMDIDGRLFIYKEHEGWAMNCMQALHCNFYRLS